MSRGFVTIATGDERYYRMARTLLRSYRQNSGDPMPFAIVCDRENEYTAEFDRVVLMDSPACSWLDKIQLLQFCPFDENLYIDADCIVYQDIDFLWDVFAGADDFSCFGQALPLGSKEGWFTSEVAQNYPIHFITHLHGVIYFIRPGDMVDALYATCQRIIKDYDQLTFKMFNGTLADEPIYALAMAIMDLKPVAREAYYYCFAPFATDLVTDYAHRAVWFENPKDGRVDTCCIVHWSSANVDSPNYKWDARAVDSAQTLRVQSACQPEQRYYRIALVGHASLCADNDLARTYRDLTALGHGVELVDPQLIPGALEEDGSANPEVLGLFLTTFNPDYVAVHGESAAEILLALAQANKGSAVRPRHVVVFGYIGKDNFGDELIFSIIARTVRERYPGSYVSVIGHDPAATLRRHGVVSVVPTMKSRVAALLDGASALVFMAGIMFDQPFVDWTCGPIDLYLNPHSEIAGQTACALLAWQYGVPTVYAGIGAGPLANRDARKLVELASLTRPRYIARDENTAELLHAAGVDPSLVEVKADVAMSLEKPAPTERLGTWLADHELEEHGYMTVALREAPGVVGDPCPAVAALCDHAYEAYGLRPVFIDFAPEDREVHRRVVEEMKHGDRAVLFGDTVDADLTLEVLGAAKTYLAMRLHCSIVSNACGIVGLGLNYNDKVEAHYDAMGLRNYLLPCDCTSDSAIGTFDALLAEYDALAADMGRAVAEQRCKAREVLSELCAVIDGAASERFPRCLYARCESVDSLQLDHERARSRALELHVEELEERLAEIEKSATWRAGRLVTAMPRALKRAWRGRSGAGGA